jgi:hypothetical protein
MDEDAVKEDVEQGLKDCKNVCYHSFFHDYTHPCLELSN